MVATFAIAVLLAAAPSAASADSICGWNPDRLPAGGVPATLAAVLARGPSPAARDAVQQFGAWVHGCDAAAGRRAALATRNALSAHRGDPVLNALLGIMLARGPEVQVPGATGMLVRAAHKFSNAEKEATRRLLAGARAQQWPELAVELAELGFATRRKATLDAAADALDAVLRAYDDAQLRVLLADVHVARRDYRRARSTAEQALGQGAPAGARALGIALLRSGESERGGEQYLHGVHIADSVALARYYEDIDLLLVPEERASWDSTGASARARWLEQGWEWRATTAAVSTAERLAEHFRRIEYALQHHTRTSFRGARPFAALWLLKDVGQHPLDDMGIIYVRHGPPDFLARANAAGGSLRVLWLYRRIEGGQATFEFDKGGMSGGDYFLMDPVTVDCHMGNLPDPGRGFGRFSRLTKAHGGYGRLPDWYIGPPTTEGVLGPCYMTAAGDSGKAEIWSGRELRQRTANVVLRTETATPPLTRPLMLLLNTYAFRGESGTELFARAAIPAAQVTPDSTAPPVSYTLRLVASIEDPASRTFTRADTMVRIGPRARFAPGDVVNTVIRLHSAPLVNATVRLRVSNQADSAQGQIVTTARGIPDFSGTRALLSDLVIAAAREGGWRRGSVGLAPLPAHATTAGAPFTVFAEGYRFTAAEPLEIEVLVAPGRREGILAGLRGLLDRREAVSLRFVEQATIESDGVLRLAKQVGGELRAGVYHLELTVRRLNTGETVTATTLLTVTER